ncbi:dynein regulatory complex subunit 2 [Pectinophora gossypiella]|uniref:dynein regulatory complex subunit 2 n=1 Tax=Pectinophora gossypiella TaxID=13191 RepID=UPI00214F520B|nr:dynein regulatory complex subunit 2 [Pectinophora gossypiella]
MGKKGKVNKLARMSDEERARYLQHRADMEEEARRRKRELIARFIKNKLDKEEAYSRMNTAKINQGWRYILRRIKCKQMGQDIEGLMISFNQTVERKNRQISSLIHAIDVSDEQHRRAFQAHTETLSYFLGIGSQRLDKLQSEYEHQKNSLLDNWLKEETDITDSQDRAEFQLKLIIFIQDRNFQNYMKTKGLERATAISDTKLEHEDNMLSFCRPKQLEIEYYWSQLREVYSSYLEQHKPIIGHYDTLKEKDEFYQRDIARNDVQIQQATEVLMNLQREWINTNERMSYKLERMNKHKEELAIRYRQMKKEDKTETSRSSHQLEVMVNCSQDAIKRMEEFKEKLDKISHLFEICRKYETDGDFAVLMTADSSTGAEDFTHLDPDMIEECKEYSKMTKFMLKLNTVRVQSMCLKAEKAKLTRENIQLKHYIKRYLTELALRGGKDRPLSVKLQSEMQKIDRAGKVVNRPVTCIEGAYCNAVLHEKRMRSMERKNKDNGIRAYPRVQCWMQTA